VLPPEPGIPLVAPSTFEAASAPLPSPADVAFVLDAGRGDVHAAWRVSGELSEEAAPLPRERALEQAARRGLPVHDLGASPLNLAAAVARLAASASDIEPVLARYGRPSAAEEKRAAALEAR
jgi:tRNA A37 threonylcarbamoyladenosine modification protein TsaB